MNKDIIFVADIFLEEYTGGAELTTEAILEKKPNEFNIIKIKSESVNKNFIDKYKENVWIFGNFSLIDNLLLLDIIKNVKQYYVIEYDFKFCSFRSKLVHKMKENVCKCNETQFGKIILLFLTKSKAVFWMSKKQFEIQKELFPPLEKTKNIILSSVFSERDIKYIKELNKVIKKKNNKFIILQSGSPVKNTGGCIEYAAKNNLQYDIVNDLPYFKLLRKLSESKGLIFLPAAEDTCPRLIIEAKLLNCEIVTNNNVLHLQEEWYNQSNELIFDYLENNVNIFWEYLRNN